MLPYDLFGKTNPLFINDVLKFVTHFLEFRLTTFFLPNTPSTFLACFCIKSGILLDNML